MKRRRILWTVLLLTGILLIPLIPVGAAGQSLSIPTVSLSIGGPDQSRASTTVQLIILLTVLAIAPTILLLMTCFTRVVVVLSLLRHALSTQTIPPNQIIIGLALFLTFFVMAPTWNRINSEALQPYYEDRISGEEALTRATQPIKSFMLHQTREKDLALFVKMAAEKRPEKPDEVSLKTLLPAFVISELKTAFQMGFIIYLPFFVIDMVVSSILLSMGMMMLPPVMVSLPFKLLLFVLVDGWYLVIGSLVQSFK